MDKRRVIKSCSQVDCLPRDLGVGLRVFSDGAVKMLCFLKGHGHNVFRILS